MATRKKAATTAALAQDADIVIPRVSMGEVGFTGLRTTNGYVIEEAIRAFRYPAMLHVVDELRLDPTIATCLSAYRLLMARAKWSVVAPIDSTEEQIERAAFVQSCLTDMDSSWETTIGNWFEFIEYGSAVVEKVFCRRLYTNGSKFNDGLVGIKKLASRARGSIQRWDFSPDRRTLLGCEQTLRYIDNSYLFQDKLDERGLIYIPRKNFMLFICDGRLDNPEGNSILKAVFLAAKTMRLLQDQESLGVAKDVQAILKITAPPRYFDPNASAGDQAVYAGFKAIIANYNSGTNQGLLVPNMVDPETKQPMFTYDLLESKGQAKFEVNTIIKRLQTDILSALSCDAIKLGSDTAGSFSLSDGGSNLLSLAVSHRLNEIKDVLNFDLIADIYSRNGWEQVNMAEFRYEDIAPVNMSDLGAYLQRVAAVGLLEVDRGVLNRVRAAGGFDQLSEDAPLNESILTTTLSGKQSSSGEGMAVGVVGEGTSTSITPQDATVANKNNKA